jgi:hypothetical protein
MLVSIRYSRALVISGVCTPYSRDSALAKIFDRLSLRRFDELISAVTALRVYAYDCGVFNAFGCPIPFSLTTFAVAKRNWSDSH